MGQYLNYQTSIAKIFFAFKIYYRVILQKTVSLVQKENTIRTIMQGRRALYRAGPAMAVPNFKDHTHCTQPHPLHVLNIEVI